MTRNKTTHTHADNDTPFDPFLARQTQLDLFQIYLTRWQQRMFEADEEEEDLLVSKPQTQEVLVRCGELDWQVRSLALARAASRQREQGPRPASTGAMVPSLRVPLSTSLLASLPQPARRLLALVDGKRSIANLARPLSKTPQEVQDASAAQLELFTYAHGNLCPA